MNNPVEFPNDASGDALRRMRAAGDDLTRPRMVDFCFIFSKRQQALAFADLVDDQDCIVCISYYAGRQLWQTIVKRHIVPDYKCVVDMEATLTIKAESVGGEADGWGCMQVRRKE
jgi:hypothetical protein